MKPNPTITVIGGSTVDVTYFVDQWPKVGESVQASSYKLVPGGKGLNQATAAARLGATVNFIGSLGNDPFSQQIRLEMANEKLHDIGLIGYDGIDTDLIGIIVNHSGSPGFIGIKNSTAKLTPSDIDSKKNLVINSQVLLVNLEISLETAIHALTVAKEAGIVTILNPAPPEPLPDNIFLLVDYFVPNLWEAQVVSKSDNMSANEMAGYFRKKGVKIAFVTLGRDGCVISSDQQSKPYLAFPVKEVDETGAGDSFCGSLAYALSQRTDLEQAVRMASAAGALTCTRVGGRSSPTMAELDKFLDKNKNFNL